ncbi:MAG: hypothetical protein HGB10_06590 [Coriobacteriia bacterium]|nr:hypothetical protein [Coriobacteriia bacterium]
MRTSSRVTRTHRMLVVALALATCMLALTGCGGAGAIPGGGGGAVHTDGPAWSDAATPTIPVARKLAAPADGAYLGTYSPPAPYTITQLESAETTAGRGVSIVMWYQPWAANNRSEFDPGTCIAVMRRGKVPMITWEPWDAGQNANDLENPEEQPDYALKRINKGDFDPYIRQWAQQIRDLGGPIMLRPMHEMNGDWYPWGGTVNGNTPAEFITAWRHIHDIFEAEGATNVTWVWSINHQSVPDTRANSYAAYYPGDKYVDWTAISGFNWGTTRADSVWKPYSKIYSEPLAYLRTLDKPIVIAEFASVEEGGDKAAWITDAYDRIAANDSVDGILYYDSVERGSQTNQDWRFATTPASAAAFSEAIARTHFLDGTPPELRDWANGLSTEEWQYLAGITPYY